MKFAWAEKNIPVFKLLTYLSFFFKSLIYFINMIQKQESKIFNC